MEMCRKSRLFQILLVLILTVSLLTGCGEAAEDGAKSGPPENSGDKIVIGFAMDTLVHERWLRDRDIFVAKAKELGAEVILQIAYSDSREQEKQVQYLLDQGIDILVLVPMTRSPRQAW